MRNIPTQPQDFRDKPLAGNAPASGSPLHLQASPKASASDSRNLASALDEHAIVSIADPRGQITYVNDKFCAISQYTRNELIGQDHRIAISSHHPQEFVRELWTTVSRGDVWRGEIKNQAKDGSYYWEDTTVVPFLDEEGCPRQYVSIGTDITMRKQAEVDLRAAEQQLRALVGRLNNVREEEARRIARELHDDLGQHLTAFNMDLADLERNLALSTPRQREHFARMQTGVAHMIEVVQQISGELRLAQLDVLGLSAAIEWQAKEFSRRSSIPSRVTGLDEIKGLSDAQNTALFRILQEALTNIARHAGATGVEIGLEKLADRVVLRIHDNGRGITQDELRDQMSIGLLGMHERAQGVGGEVAIAGGPGKGTTVVVQIPHNRASPPPP
jgi:two-component system, NarL family, sensor histidine kinase NreB